MKFLQKLDIWVQSETRDISLKNRTVPPKREQIDSLLMSKILP